MEKKITLLLLLIFHISFSNTVEVHIFINTSNCLGCNAVNSMNINKLKDFKKVYYIPENDIEIAKEIISETFGFDTTNCEYRYVNKSVFFPNNKKVIPTFCKIFHKEKNTYIDSFPIQYLNKWYKNFFTLKEKIWMFPDSIKLSDQIDVNYNANVFTLIDKSLNKILIFEIKDDQLKILDFIKVNNLNIENFLKCGCINKELFEKEMKYLRFLHADRPLVEFAYFDGKYMHASFKLGSPVIDVKKGDTIIDYMFFVMRKQPGKANYSLSCLGNSDSKNPDFKLFNKYYTTSMADFFVQNDILYFNSYLGYVPPASEFKPKNYLFLKFKFIENATCSYLEPFMVLSDVKGLENFQTEVSNERYILKSVNRNLFFLRKFPLFFVTENKQLFFINNQDIINQIQYTIITDACIADNGNAVKILIYLPDSLCYYKTDNKNKILEKKMFHLKNNSTSLVYSFFYDDNLIASIDRKKIVLRKIFD